MTPPLDTALLHELTLARDRLARAEGAREQADRAVEAARAAARRQAEAVAELEALVDRLYGELTGREGSPYPLLDGVLHHRDTETQRGDPDGGPPCLGVSVVKEPGGPAAVSREAARRRADRRPVAAKVRGSGAAAIAELDAARGVLAGRNGDPAAIVPLEELLAAESDADAGEARDDDQGDAEARRRGTFTRAAGRGPDDEHQALKMSLGFIPGIDDLIKTGATDREILERLEGWPTHRELPGRAGGQPWATRGGDDPMFFYGQSAERNWPQGPPFVTGYGERLANAVRRLLRIPQPKAAPRRDPPAAPAPHAREDGPPGRAADRPPAGWNDATLRIAAEDLGIDPLMLCICGECGAARDKSDAAGLTACPSCGCAEWEAVISKHGVLITFTPTPTPARGARKADGQPVPAGHPLEWHRANLDGYRPCTRAEYRAAAPADRHPRWRALRVLPDSGNAVTEAERAKPGECVETRPDGSAIDDETAKLARRAADAIEADAVARWGADGKGGITPGAEIAHRKAARKRARAKTAAAPAEAPAPIAGGAPAGAARVGSGARALIVPPPPPEGDGLPNWRPCTESEWILAGESRRHPNFRLVRGEVPI